MKKSLKIFLTTLLALCYGATIYGLVMFHIHNPGIENFGILLVLDLVMTLAGAAGVVGWIDVLKNYK